MRRNRTVNGFCKEFGVKVVRSSDYGVTYPVYGRPPISWVYFSFNYEGAPVVVVSGSYDPTPEDILHEMCHLLAGPEALEDEDYLMPLQWAFIQALRERERLAAIRDFGSFGIGGVQITPRVRQLIGRPKPKPYVVLETWDLEVCDFPGETFTEIQEWENMTRKAQVKGLLAKDGEPVTGMSIPPLSAWKEHRVV